MLVSYSIFKVLKDEFGFDLSLVSFLAGHSLGEYSALVCSKSLDFNDALYLLHERGKAMQEAVPVGEGTMIAVLGLSIDKINNLIENRDEKEGICEIANDNAEGQVIISGNKTIENLQISLKEKIKSIPHKVGALFHCSLMKKVADKMKVKIDKVKFSEPSIEIVNCVMFIKKN